MWPMSILEKLSGECYIFLVIDNATLIKRYQSSNNQRARNENNKILSRSALMTNWWAIETETTSAAATWYEMDRNLADKGGHEEFTP